MALQLFHNPRCSKSRATLALLESKGLEPHIVEYLEEPQPSNAQGPIALGCKAIEMIRAQESIFGELGLTADVDDETLLRAVTEHPLFCLSDPSSSIKAAQPLGDRLRTFGYSLAIGDAMASSSFFTTADIAPLRQWLN